MESIVGAGVQTSFSAGALAGAIKDTTGFQIINKTLERINPGQAVNSDYQFQKAVLNAAGIGNNLDTIV